MQVADMQHLHTAAWLRCLALAAALSHAGGVTVERVYFGSETEWATYSPVYVRCDVTEEVGEEVQEVLYHHEGDLVYRWALNETIQALGLLEDRVELPSNASDWTIKITRMTCALEGNFSCSALSSRGDSDTSSFPFIVLYEPDASITTSVSDELCHFNVSFLFPHVFPRPFTLCYLAHDPSAFFHRLSEQEHVSDNPDGTYYYRSTVSAMFWEYPEGSYLRCHDYCYGVYMERLNWTVTEAPSCSAPPAPRPGFDLAEIAVTPGCRGYGTRQGSRVRYTCQHDAAATIESACLRSGLWSADLAETPWPACSAGTAVVTSWIVLLLPFIISHFIVT